MSKATLHIGVSGHQHIGNEATIEFVSQQLRELLSTFQCQAQECGQDILDLAHNQIDHPILDNRNLADLQLWKMVGRENLHIKSHALVYRL